MHDFPPVLYRGSVKNVRGEVSAESLLFEFSDRYSIFDWGEMPDTLIDKGKSLAIMGKCFFSYLEKKENWVDLFKKLRKLERFDEIFLANLEASEQYQDFKNSGLRHHADLKSDEVNWDSSYLKVKNIKIIRPSKLDGIYNYTSYSSKPVNALVPLEIIFRLSLPEGNSFSKRINNLSSVQIWKDYGIKNDPDSNHPFGHQQRPIIDFSTKLENGDRYLSYDEAQLISGLNNVEFQRLKDYAKLIGLNLFLLHQEMGIDLLDGKVEVATVKNSQNSNDENRHFMLVDSVGIDELRLVKSGRKLSKDFLRDYYKQTNWYKALENSKKDASFHGLDFRAICLAKYKEAPDPLDTHIKEKVESLYRSYANDLNKKICGHSCFLESFNLDQHFKRFE